MIILALDALDHQQVEKHRCKNLMQAEHGQTDISDFTLPRTVVLWASFLTSRNMEAQIPIEGQWEFTLQPDETFLRFVENHHTVDVPALSLKQRSHAEERDLLKKYFQHETTIKTYDSVVFRNHEENKKDFFKSLGKFDLLMGYFDLADAVGHLSFGVPERTSEVYTELEGIAEEVRSSTDDTVLIISDHGMKALGRYGDHSENGFYSLNRPLKLRTPKITQFYGLIEERVLR